MSELSTGKSSGISALFSGGFIAIVGAILSILASPIVLHFIPANIAAIITAIAVGYASWKSNQKQIETHDTATVAANNAAAAAQTAAIVLKNTPAAGQPAISPSRSPMQGGGKV